MSVTATMDKALLARMTGRLGDRRTIDAIAGALGTEMALPLAEGAQKVTGATLEIELKSVTAGTKAEIAAGFDDTQVLCEAAIAGWCDDLLLACDGRLAIALTERLLGGTGEAPAASRPLSEIEQDVATLFFEQMIEAMKRAVGKTADEHVGSCGTPFAGPLKREEDLSEDLFVACPTITIELAGTVYHATIVLPQHVALKTQVVSTKPERRNETAQRPRWVEQLTQQVHTSSVSLQAEVDLAPVSLALASRLRAGDVIPFADERDVRVLLKANGKDLYWCEFGKSGDRYMLRLKDRYGSELDFIRQLAG